MEEKLINFQFQHTYTRKTSRLIIHYYAFLHHCYRNKFVKSARTYFYIGIYCGFIGFMCTCRTIDAWIFISGEKSVSISVVSSGLIPHHAFTSLVVPSHRLPSFFLISLFFVLASGPVFRRVSICHCHVSVTVDMLIL